jgi:hypothetical protein
MSGDQTIKLLDNAAITGASKPWLGGRGTVMVEGTFGGATVTLQFQTPRGAWVNVGSAAIFTAGGAANFELGAVPIRMLVAGGNPSALHAYVVGTRNT